MEFLVGTTLLSTLRRACLRLRYACGDAFSAPIHFFSRVDGFVNRDWPTFALSVLARARVGRE
jgi:hypothetical protein